MISETIPAIAKLTRDQKLQLAGELWDEAGPDANPATHQAIGELLDARAADFRAHPETAVPWETVRKKLDELRHS